MQIGQRDDIEKSTLHERFGAFSDIFKNCQRKLYQ
jgi:hypothetical protein